MIFPKVKFVIFLGNKCVGIDRVGVCLFVLDVGPNSLIQISRNTVDIEIIVFTRLKWRRTAVKNWKGKSALRKKCVIMGPALIAHFQDRSPGSNIFKQRQPAGRVFAPNSQPFALWE